MEVPGPDAEFPFPPRRFFERQDVGWRTDRPHRIRSAEPCLAQRLGWDYPRPTKGILVAMMVMNCTFAFKGRLAIYTTASATCSTFMVGSAEIVPSAFGTTAFLFFVT